MSEVNIDMSDKALAMRAVAISTNGIINSIREHIDDLDASINLFEKFMSKGELNNHVGYAMAKVLRRRLKSTMTQVNYLLDPIKYIQNQTKIK